MIEAAHSITIEAGIDAVWDFVQDIERWASLMPGSQTCTVIDRHDSRWTLKVGAGGLVRTVHVLVHVDRWDGPERVEFSYQLENDPVKGSGAYIATRQGVAATQAMFELRVEGSGPMAPMWEAVCKPLLPQLAKSFAGKLKAEIERTCGTPAAEEMTDAERPSVWTTIGRKLHLKQ